jgi:glycosyltransferase involved in cell wall biosynthesis
LADANVLHDAAAAPVMLEPGSIAVVHDYLNQCGGAERVVLEMTKIWPEAPVYTSLYRPGSTFPEFTLADVRTSALNRVPVDKGFRSLAPLYPWAFNNLGILSHDVVISSSSGWAHSIRTSPRTLHVVYCHNPARWLYRPHAYLGHSVGRALMAPLSRGLRRWDRRAAHLADVYVANCQHVRGRILDVYGLDAAVIYPPVSVDRFTPSPRGDRLLVISRLLPYKRVDLVVLAATRAGIGLDVIGVGPELDALRAIAGPTVAFHGRVDDEDVKRMLESCRALCVAATEDFGVVAVEANAAGKPVIAHASGGALESIEADVNGVFFTDLTVDSLLAAIRRADGLAAEPAVMRAHAERFSTRVFHRAMRELISQELTRRNGSPAAV